MANEQDVETYVDDIENELNAEELTIPEKVPLKYQVLGAANNRLFVQTTVKDLALAQIGTESGVFDNQAFYLLDDGGFGSRLIQCEYDPQQEKVLGNFSLQCLASETSLVEMLIQDGGGSVIATGEDTTPGFRIFAQR